MGMARKIFDKVCNYGQCYTINYGQCYTILESNHFLGGCCCCRRRRHHHHHHHHHFSLIIKAVHYIHKTFDLSDINDDKKKTL